ncbi:conserved hypothetical protein [Ixodes scapularis]|uniref:Queuosine 5'-phosphate N-glycosylase/hydrolase n=1 Tax=Ixodes scapularis TaxID=6945 RepID=B7P388_IXOSC|nr:conserved hypothetical protein [Ixodes scapularis]|eukprot:XP_002403704.1 conserved hypothetical protein [Ixodes scapularis]
MKALSPRRSAEFIVQNAMDVTVDPVGICNVADHVQDCFSQGTVSKDSWRKHPLHPKALDNSTVQWIFFVDALNFCFWSQNSEEKCEIEFDGRRHTGYWSLCAAVNRAIQASIPLLDAQFCRDISHEQVEHIFRSCTPVPFPLLEERHRILRECGQVLCTSYGGEFANCILRSNRSCQKLLDELVTNVPSFRDEGIFNGVPVSFYKRAQILVADIWACFGGQGLGEFEDIGTLTAFADYRVPQVLAHFGALRYSERLSSLLQSGVLLQNGDKEEMEIRGATIHACELVCEELKRRLQGDAALGEINSILVDFCLWDYRRKRAADLDHVPFHRVRSCYY